MNAWSKLERRISGGPAALALAILALALAPAAAAAEPWAIDPSFGGGGFTLLNEPGGTTEQLYDVLVLPDGKILGAGSTSGSSGFLLARINADGSPDLGFGTGGFMINPDTNTPGSPRGLDDVELLPDGKIIAAGLTRNPTLVNGFGIARYLATGVLDAGFGTGGITTIALPESAAAQGVAPGPGGTVVASGRSISGKAPVARVTATGAPDAGFGPSGFREIDVPGTTGEQAHAVRVLADGSVLVGGASGKGAFLAKLSSTGIPVVGFGGGGVALHDLGTGITPSGSIEELHLLADGRFLAVGSATTVARGRQLFVARFTENGALDPTFGSGGVFRADPTEGEDEGSSLALLPDGRILAAGLRGEINPESGDTWLVRLSPDGQPDTSFGPGGEAFASAVAGKDEATGVGLQADGRAVIGGLAATSTGLELLFGRFAETPPTPPAAAPGGGEPTTPKVRCKGRLATIVGTARRDRLVGTPRADVIAALAGADKIIGRGGNDVICAGAGNDLAKGGKGRDLILGQAGFDRLFGGKGSADRLFGGPANDRLAGGGGKRDLCNGGPGKRDRGARGCERKRRIP